ncbi:MAG: hypothetical protein L0G99_13415 [Propionibacteriales bacterium]|nr:hypothetical protein [Propionibacteriales bacterium]
MLDEAVAHMMQVIVDAMAISLGSIVLIALGPIEGGWQRATAIVASATLGAIGTHLGLAMIFLVTQLYAAYGHRNRIRRALDGNEPHVRPQVRRSKKAKSPKGAD